MVAGSEIGVWDQHLALPAGAMLLQKQVAEPSFEAVNEFQRGIFFR